MSEPILLSGTLNYLSSSKQQPGSIWLYDYIKVNGERINNVCVVNYLNEELRDCVEEEISLSLMPMPQKQNFGLVSALRRGNRVERAPELTLGQALGITLLGFGQNIFLYAIAAVALVALITIVLSIPIGMLYGPGQNIGDSYRVFNTAGYFATPITFGLMFHRLFLSKKSLMGTRKPYNAATRALG